MNIRRILFVATSLVAAVILSYNAFPRPVTYVPPRVQHAYAPVNFETLAPWTIVYTAPPVYDKWWAEIESCTGLSLDAAVTHSLRFVYVDAVAFWVVTDPNFQLDIGYTDYQHNTIYLVRASMLEEQTVKHEMTHILMVAHGDMRDHPSEYFDKCHLR